MGGLGSLIFLGLVLGSATATVIIDKFQYKHILLCSMVVNGLGLIMMTLTEEYYLMCIARLLSGFS